MDQRGGAILNCSLSLQEEREGSNFTEDETIRSSPNGTTPCSFYDPSH